MVETIYLSSLAPKTIESDDWEVLAETEPSPAFQVRVLLHKNQTSTLVLGNKGVGIDDFQDSALYYGYQSEQPDFSSLMDHTAELIHHLVKEMGLEPKKAQQLSRKLKTLPLKLYDFQKENLEQGQESV